VSVDVAEGAAVTFDDEIGSIIRVNRKNDEHTISNKTFDFSRKTINELRESGYKNIEVLSDVEFG
jgi:hypothetical protein